MPRKSQRASPERRASLCSAAPQTPNNMTPIRDATVEMAVTICRRDISQLFDIWTETGYRNDVLNKYGEQVISHLEGLMKDMIGESAERRADLLKNVKALASTACKISKELGSSFSTDIYNDLPLMELELKLKEQVEQLQHIKDHRLEYMKELQVKALEICKKMGIKPIGFKSELPSEQEIKEFENYLDIQEIEKNRLSVMFKDTRRAVIKMMDELQISPALDFERMVCHDHDNFIFSPNNMTKLRDLRERLKDQIEEAKLQAQEKRETLIALWDYLDEPMEARQAFLEAHTGYSLITLNALHTEIKRCKEKRSENIANYVMKVRNEIESLWNLLKYSELQKKSFTAMKCQTYTEDLLTLHEIEVEKLRKYYNSNRKIFELLNEWEVQFGKLKELDQRANDPDRYHNRGGQLLLEEKERKTVEKKLPKLENQLCVLVDEYENICKAPFLIHGYSLQEFLSHSRDNYEVEKENMKLARKQAKDKSLKKTPLSTSKRTPGTSILRITPASNRLRAPGGTNMSRITPAAKRKLPYDVSPANSDIKKRVVTAEKSKATVLCNKVRRSGRQTPAGVTLNGNRVKNVNKKKRRSKNDSLLSESYENFQEHLENRDELRSSVVPNDINKKLGSMTPMKTPIKPKRRRVLADSTPLAANSTRTLRGTPRSPKMATPRLIPIKNTSPIEI